MKKNILCVSKVVLRLLNNLNLCMYGKKFQELDVELDVKRRRNIRANIVIKGFSDGIRNLRQYVFKIAYLCNVHIVLLDIQDVCYMDKGKSLLVKFNSISVLDNIMASYNSVNHLFLCDIKENNVRGKVYLNDHLHLLNDRPYESTNLLMATVPKLN